MLLWGTEAKPEPLHQKEWFPKNPEVKVKARKGREPNLTAKEWKDSNFPYYPIPEEITTHVNLVEWKKRLKHMKKSQNDRLLLIMTEMLI